MSTLDVSFVEKTDWSLDIWNPRMVARTEKVRRMIVSLKNIREFVHPSLKKREIMVR
jgi:hypothetical protein